MVGSGSTFTSIGGAILGFLTSFIVLKASLQPNPALISPLVENFTGYRPQTIGFQPFWLVNEFSQDMLNFIDTLAYFSLRIDGEGKIIKLINPQEEEPGWTNLRSQRLKELFTQARSKDLDLSLVVHLSDEATIQELLTNPSKHAQNLVNEIIPILKKNQFVDLNLDIESFRPSSPKDQENYLIFISEVSRLLKEVQPVTLTVEISAISLVKPRLTDPKRIAKVADYLVLMAYDFHYLDSLVSGPVAPLEGAGLVREFDVQTAVSEALKVIPQDKLILGIPLYGYEWETLIDRPGAPVIPGSGSIASQRRTNRLKSQCQDCQAGYDVIAKAPYLVFPDRTGSYFHQIFYEDQQSIKAKFELVQKKELVGVAFWALGYQENNLSRFLTSLKR